MLWNKFWLICRLLKRIPCDGKIQSVLWFTKIKVAKATPNFTSNVTHESETRLTFHYLCAYPYLAILQYTLAQSLNESLFLILVLWQWLLLIYNLQKIKKPVSLTTEKEFNNYSLLRSEIVQVGVYCVTVYVHRFFKDSEFWQMLKVVNSIYHLFSNIGIIGINFC